MRITSKKSKIAKDVESPFADPAMNEALNGRHLVVVISGPSGAGKSTLIQRVLDAPLPCPVTFSVSATTRKPRPGEKNGVNYYFVDKHEFKRRAEGDEFFEWANVHDAMYGTPKSEVDRAKKAGADLLLELDVQGAMNVRKALPGAVLIFLYTSETVLRERIRGRKSGLSREESEKMLELRMINMRKELEYAPQYDYLLKNDSLEEAVESVLAIVRAEKIRIPRNP